MTTRHTQGFKEQAVQKALTRGDSVSVKTIATELNVGYSTLQNWIRKTKAMSDTIENRRPGDWSRQQQLQAIIDTAPLNAEHCSQYCREKGLFPHHLDEWRDRFIKGDAQPTRSHRDKLHLLKKENNTLHKELRRKEKALAETAALLVLQKKFQALLEDKGE